jgi:UDP-3-O-[3-hydroxymyristoyl] glucosamine N-acyltransferase
MMITARELADRLGAALEGDPSQAVTGIASPEKASETDLVFVEGQKHLPRAARSRSRCVLLAPGAALEGKTLLRAANPKLAFARAAEWLVPATRVVAAAVHPTAVIALSAQLARDVAVGAYAVVEEGAEIGAGCQIGAFCCVGRGAVLGPGCTLYPHVVLYPGVRLGRDVILHAGTVIGGDGFGYVFDGSRYLKFPQVGDVEIGDEVEIGCNTCVDRGALGATRIGAGTKIDNLVQVAHNVTIGEQALIVSQTGISGSSTIGRRAMIGGQVGIADNCEIADGAVVGAQAGIPTGKTVRAGEVYWGTPARPMSKFKEQYAWLSRLPELGEEIRRLRGERGGDAQNRKGERNSTGD